MENCEDQVVAAMGGAPLSPSESMLVKDFCGKGFAAFMIADLLLAERAGAELAALMKASGLGNDEELWKLAFELLKNLKDPQKALDQAQAAVNEARAKKTTEALQETIKKLRKTNLASGARPDDESSGIKPK